MAQDESLRLVAEVVDKFSGPLKNLRATLQGVAAGQGIRELPKQFEGAQKGAAALGREVSTIVTPALAAAGIAGVGLGSALVGVGAAMRSFSSQTAALSLLSREVGVSAERLRQLQSLGGRFGIDPAQMTAGVQAFAGNLDQIRRKTGDTYNWLAAQAQRNGGMRDAFQGLVGSKTTEEALGRTLDLLSRIPDPMRRAQVAARLLGSEAFAILGSEGPEKLRQHLDEIAKNLGKLPQGAQESALAFERQMSAIGETLRGLRDEIGKEALPAVNDFLKALREGFQGQGEPFGKAVADGIRLVAAELKEVDWKAAGTGLGWAFKEASTFIKDVSKAIRETIELVEAANRAYDTLSKNVGAAVDTTKREVGKTLSGERAGGAPSGGVIGDVGRRDIGPLMMRQAEIQKQIAILDENISRKESAPDPLGGNDHVRASSERERRDRLTEEMKRLSDEVRKLREQGATVQKSASEAAFGAGGLIQSAAFGGGGFGAGDRAGWLGRVVGGYRGVQRERYGGAPGPGETGGTLRGHREQGDGLPSPGSGRGKAAPTGAMMAYAMDQLRREGVPEGQLRQSAAHLVGQAHMESGLDPNKIHDGGTGYGIYGARDPTPGRGRKSSMLRWLKENGYAANSAEGQMRYMAHEAMSGRYPATRRVLLGQGTGDADRDTDTITGEFEAPKIINRRSGAVREALRVGPQKAEAAPPQAAQRPYVGGEDFDAARRFYGGRREPGDLRMMPDASVDMLRRSRKSGFGGDRLQVEGSGRITVDVNAPRGTKATASADGMFKEVVLNRGSAMALASEAN